METRLDAKLPIPDVAGGASRVADEAIRDFRFWDFGVGDSVNGNGKKIASHIRLMALSLLTNPLGEYTTSQ